MNISSDIVSKRWFHCSIEKYDRILIFAHLKNAFRNLKYEL